MSNIIETILANLPLRKPVDKVISSSRSGTELRAFIQKFRPFVDDVQSAIVDLNERVTDATSTTINMDLAALNLPPDIQSQVHLHVTGDLTIGNPDAPGGGAYPQPPTEYWDDSVNPVEFFVDTTGGGSDTNDGLSELTPFATIEKAVELLRTKQISWNWNTTLRIKGTVQAPLNLTGIKGNSSSAFQSDFLFLNKWQSENNPWILNVPSSDSYGSKKVIDNNSSDVGFFISNATIQIEKYAVFENLNLSLSNSCTILPGEFANNGCLSFSSGNYDLNGITWNLTHRSSSCFIYARGADTYVKLRLEHKFINGEFNNLPYALAEDGGLIDAKLLTFKPSGLNQTLSGDGTGTIFAPTSQKVQPLLNSALILTTDSKQHRHISTQNFSSLTDGRILVAYSPQKGRLVGWKLSALTGNGTFQLEAGGVMFASPITKTFNNYDQSVDYSATVLSFSTDGTPLFLNVTASTGLAGVTLQLIWEPN